jgi:hypothetical protein
VKLKAHAHGAHVRIAGEISGAMPGMFGAEAWWNKQLDFLSGEFGALLALGVGEHNTALLIDHKHRVRSGVQDRPEVSFDRTFHELFPVKGFYTSAARF